MIWTLFWWGMALFACVLALCVLLCSISLPSREEMDELIKNMGECKEDIGDDEERQIPSVWPNWKRLILRLIIPKRFWY